MQTSGENKGWLKQEASFSNEIEMVILKLKRIVVHTWRWSVAVDNQLVSQSAWEHAMITLEEKFN